MKHLAIVLGIFLFSISACPCVHAADVVVDGSKRHQTIDGFGTCLISWEPRMDRFNRTPEAQRMFASEQGFNVIRCNLWGDGTIPLTQDPEKLSHKDPAFAAKDPRTSVFIAFAKAIKQINPDVRVIGTVWSPPAWMKENNSITDKLSAAIDGKTYKLDKGNRGETTNRVKPEFYPHFARWLVEMCKYYEAHGVPLYAVSCANEPQFTQGFESCVWTAKDLATITGMVGDLLAGEGMNVKTFGPETMTGFNWPGGPNQTYVKALADNPAAWRSLGFIASHGYADGVKGDVSKNSSAQFWQIIADRGKPYWVTEGATGHHKWPAPLANAGVAAAIHNALVAGNASAFVPWQFAEGGDSEHAITSTKELDKKGYVTRQFSRFIPAGSVRVDATPAYGDVNASAYVNDSSKTLTVVLINPGKQEQAVTLTLSGTPVVESLKTIRTSATESGAVLAATAVRGGKATVTLPAESVVTLTNVEAPGR
jgi:O-glycosyl hydrolase